MNEDHYPASYIRHVLPLQNKYVCFTLQCVMCMESFWTNMYRHTYTLNFTIMFIQLIANVLAHYLLSADDGCQRIQACILGCAKRGKKW